MTPTDPKALRANCIGDAITLRTDHMLALLDRLERAEAEVARLGDWERLAALLRTQESRLMGALCDARDLPTADMVEDVRTLIRQRDEARAALARAHVDDEQMRAALAHHAEAKVSLRAVADAARDAHETWIAEWGRRRGEAVDDVVVERRMGDLEETLAALDAATLGQRETIARVVAWLRAERKAWPQYDDLHDMLAAFSWVADAIERGDWKEKSDG
jgi:hypothetical protein